MPLCFPMAAEKETELQELRKLQSAIVEFVGGAKEEPHHPKELVALIRIAKALREAGEAGEG